MSFTNPLVISVGADIAICARRSAVRIGDFVALTKPRVMSLVIFTAMVGFTVAPGHSDVLTGSIALLCIAAGGGSAGVLNMWHEAGLDAIMIRTAKRPIPSGRISRGAALILGLGLAAIGVVILSLVNLLAAALLAFTIFFMLSSTRCGSNLELR